MAARALGWLRWGVIAMFVAVILGGFFVPVYTDEIGWRFQERAGFDGVDKMFSELCGPNTLAVPPFFMMPVRWFSALLGTLFADPLFVRLSGILYALLWGWLLYALIGRIAASPRERIVLACIGFGLLCLANLPLLMVLSRPEQPLILSAMGAALIVMAGWRSDGEEGSATPAWLRSLGILALAIIAQSYHLKGLFLLPVFLGAIWLASRGAAALLPRVASTTLLLGATAMSTLYWMHRFQCPGEANLRIELAKNNIGARLGDVHGWQDVPPLIGKLIGNISVFDYVSLATPRRFPLSNWLASGQIDDATSFRWFLMLVLVWGAALTAALVCLALAAWRSWRARRIDPRMALSVLLMVTILGWSATQAIRNVYESGFVLPLLMLAIVLAIASVRAEDKLGTGIEVVAVLAGLCALASPPLLAAVWGPSLARAAQQTGFIREQPHSVTVLGYARLKPDIVGAARLCKLPEPGEADQLLVDELTYFTYMRSRLPQMTLGVLFGWNGAMNDPSGYLKSRGSEGIIVSCHFLPPHLRAKARQQGQFCCVSGGDI